MKILQLLFLVSSTLAAKLPVGDNACSDVHLDAKTNIWTKYTLHPNIFWRDEVQAASKKASDATIAKKALALENTGTFLWV
jgi:cellulose 1,4-beta-cellobiosidase